MPERDVKKTCVHHEGTWGSGVQLQLFRAIALDGVVGFVPRSHYAWGKSPGTHSLEGGWTPELILIFVRKESVMIY